MHYITVLKSLALKNYIVLRTQIIHNPFFCTLSGRTGGYPDDDLIKLKKKKKKSEKRVGLNPDLSTIFSAHSDNF